MKLGTWFSVLRDFFRRNRLEHEMSDELAFHLECQIRNNIHQGMAPREARRAALLEFGGIPQVQEECRQALGFRPFDELHQDLRYAARQLIRNPGFAFLSVLVLALGIGANTAVLSVMDILIYRPLPVNQPERLMRNLDLISYRNYLDLKQAGEPVAEFAAASWFPLEIWDSEYSESLSGRAVSANFFDVLGLKMAAGRPFLPEEERISDARPVAIVSYRLWQRRFGSSPAAIGKTIRLNGEPLTIVGVAPEHFRDVNYNGSYRDVWIPLNMFRSVQHLQNDRIWSDVFEQRNKPFLMFIGRLNPGMSPEQARARLTLAADQLKKAYPESVKYFQSEQTWNLQLVPLNAPRIPGESTKFSLNVLLSAAFCILLICCANVGSLFLARASVRQREIATRYAVGASRFRVFRQLLTECLVISALALAASFAVWKLTLRCIPELEGSLNEGAIGSMQDLELTFDQRTFVIAALIAIVANLIFAIVPALLGSRSGIGKVLKDGGYLHAGSGLRWRRILVVAQVILSFILLVGAGLFIRTLQRFASADPGFDKSVLVVKPGQPYYGFMNEKNIGYRQRAIERVRAIPGVQAASWATASPPEAGGTCAQDIRPERSEKQFVGTWCNAVSSEYFRTLQIPLKQGRDFTDRDDNLNSPRVVVINESLARQFWPNETALGKRIQFRNAAQEPARFAEVVGIVGDAGYNPFWRPVPFAYFPMAQIGYDDAARKLHVRSAGDPAFIIESIRKVFQSFGTEAAVREVRPVSAEIEMMLARERSTAFVLSVFGSLALLLASIGLYGAISYSAARRSREFGIRLALGAPHGKIAMLVLREGLATVAAGLIFGIPCAIGLSRLIGNRLHGMSPLDPISYVSIALLWVLVSIVAVLAPARKAIANPLQALRVD